MEIKGRKRVKSAMAKYSETEVRYRPAIAGAKRRCNNCINYQEAESGCTMLRAVSNLTLFATFVPTTLKEMQGEGPG